MREEWIQVGGARIFVTIAGSGRPVLLLNGLGASHAMWQPLIAGLGEGFEVIAFDAPGVGRSAPWPLRLTIPSLAKLVGTLQTQLGHDQVDVIGYSFGGAVAQELARQSSTRIRRLVLVGSTCGWGGVPGTPASLAVLSMPLRYYSRPFYLATASMLAGGQAERDPDFVRTSSDARLRYPPSMAGYVAQITAISHWTSWPWLHKIEPPTLVLHGDEDPVSPEANGWLLASRIPRARLRVQPGEGHFLLLDPASASIPAVTDFLSATTYTASRTWKDAVEVDEGALARALRATQHSAQPFAALSALMRSVMPTS